MRTSSSSAGCCWSGRPSGVRGFNYQSAPTIGHTEHWLRYSAAETERDLDFARRLQLNQMRVFVPYAAWEQDKTEFHKNLVHLVRAAHQRGIGVMPTIQYGRGVSMDKARWPESKEFVADLVATIGKEPGLAFGTSPTSPGGGGSEMKCTDRGSSVLCRSTSLWSSTTCLPCAGSTRALHSLPPELLPMRWPSTEWRFPQLAS